MTKYFRKPLGGGQGEFPVYMNKYVEIMGIKSHLQLLILLGPDFTIERSSGNQAACMQWPVLLNMFRAPIFFFFFLTCEVLTHDVNKTNAKVYFREVYF